MTKFWGCDYFSVNFEPHVLNKIVLTKRTVQIMKIYNADGKYAYFQWPYHWPSPRLSHPTFHLPMQVISKIYIQMKTWKFSKWASKGARRVGHRLNYTEPGEPVHQLVSFATWRIIIHAFIRTLWSIAILESRIRQKYWNPYVKLWVEKKSWKATKQKFFWILKKSNNILSSLHDFL